MDSSACRFMSLLCTQLIYELYKYAHSKKIYHCYHKHLLYSGSWPLVFGKFYINLLPSPTTGLLIMTTGILNGEKVNFLHFLFSLHWSLSYHMVCSTQE